MTNQIASLRGAPITVLFTLLSLGGTAKTSKLRRVTGYSQPTISHACQMLSESGLIIDGLTGWTVLGVGLQHILGVGKNFLPTATDSYIDSKQIPLQLPEAEGKNILLLRKCGIGSPILEQLATLDEGFIADHVDAWVAERPKKTTALLIHRIRSGDIPPETEASRKRKETEAERTRHQADCEWVADPYKECTCGVFARDMEGHARELKERYGAE